MVGVLSISRINSYSLEKKFEDILKIYPYLLDESLVGGKLENQYKIVLSEGNIRYIDIIYFKEDEIVIIELKKDKVLKNHIQQLAEYVDHLKKRWPGHKIRGILTGQNLDYNLERSLRLRGFSFRKYFKDIPFKLKMCDNCRRAVRITQKKCKWCNSETFLKI